MSIFKEFNDNFYLTSCTLALPQNVTGVKYSAKKQALLIDHLKVFIPYFCWHPRRIVDEIGLLKETALDSIIQDLYNATGKSNKVWHGVVGEVLATAYVLSFTGYKIPIFKLRASTNMAISMPGDDLLGFKVSDDGKPISLLILEAKNYQDGSKTAVLKAYDTLNQVKNSEPVLLQFVIHQLDHEKDYNAARIIQRFLNKYKFQYEKQYTAFIVTDTNRWNDQYFLGDGSTYATPLNAVVFLINDWKKYQDTLTYLPNSKPKKSIDVPTLELDDINEVNSLLENGAFKSDQSRLASSVLSTDLKVDQTRKTTDYRFDYNKLESAATSLSISAYRIAENNPTSANNIIVEAARIFERLAIWCLENNLYNKALNNILDGAILYCVAGYNANAKVLIDKVAYSKDLSEKITHGLPHKLLAALISGRLIYIQDLLADYFLNFSHIDISEDDSEDKLLEHYCETINDISDWLIAKSYSKLLEYLRTGDEAFIAEIDESLDQASKYYLTVGNLKSYALANSTKRIFDNVINNSTRKIITSKKEIDDKWNSYIRVLTFTGKYPMNVLWKSQQKVIDAGLLEDKSLIISMPTSSGKTKIIELAIFNTINEDSEAICVYVVPTRALASEVEASLASNLNKFGIGVSVLYGGYESYPVEDEILTGNNVIVLTPEKLDLLLRSNDTFKDKLKLLIIDEVHDVASIGDRSLRTEFIYSRAFYLAHKNNIKVICLSAVMNNPEDFAICVTGNKDNIVETNWKPTGTRTGLFTWYAGFSAQILYSSQPNQYPIDNFYVPLLFSKLNLRDRNDHRKLEVAARLGEYYSQTGTTLIFTTTKFFVEAIIDELFILNDSHEASAEQEEIALKCANILGDDHKLVKAIRMGFCYHHAGLPRVVKRILEDAVRENIIPLIVSTTTLSQGVNLPIKNIIVHSLHHGDLVSMSQFWNVAGRAGRAGFETEGHVIFCFKDDLERVEKDGKSEKSESFITSGLKSLLNSRLPSLNPDDSLLDKWALASTKQFRKNGERYEEWSDRLSKNAEVSKESILSIIDSQLMAWLIEASIDEVSDEDIKQIFNFLLCNIQIINLEDHYEEFKAEIKNRIIQVKENVPNEALRKLFNQTGLGISSNTLLEEYAKILSENIEEYAESSSLPTEFWTTTHQVLWKLSELKDLKRIKTEVLLDWLSGKEYSELATDHYEGNIEKVVNDIEKITYLMPWGLNAIVQHLKHINQERIPHILKEISGLIVLGVPNKAAMYAIYFGIKDRKTAIIIGELFISQNKGDFSMFEFILWMYSLDLDEVDKYLEEKGLDNLRIATFFASLKQKKSSELDSKEIIEINYQGNIPDNTNPRHLIIVKSNNNYMVATHDYQSFWELTGDKLSVLKQSERTMYELIIESIDFVDKTVRIRTY